MAEIIRFEIRTGATVLESWVLPAWHTPSYSPGIPIYDIHKAGTALAMYVDGERVWHWAADAEFPSVDTKEGE